MVQIQHLNLQRFCDFIIMKNFLIKPERKKDPIVYEKFRRI